MEDTFIWGMYEKWGRIIPYGYKFDEYADNNL